MSALILLVLFHSGERDVDKFGLGCDGQLRSKHQQVNNVTVPQVTALINPILNAALLSPSTSPGINVGLHFRAARATLPQIRAETLIGSQANYEIQIKVTIYFYKIMISYEKYSTLNLY